MWSRVDAAPEWVRPLPSLCGLQVLEKEVFPLVSGFYDTPFIAWLLKTRPEYAAKVFFEDQIGINRHFAAIDWGTETPPLVSHFAGALQ